MEKVYCVFQASGSYDMYSYDLKGICKTKEKALELKEELDKNVISKDDIYTIIPEDIFNHWPYIGNCDEDIDDDSTPISEYKGYTREQYEEQDKRFWIFHEENSPAVIEEFELI